MTVISDYLDYYIMYNSLYCNERTQWQDKVYERGVGKKISYLNYRGRTAKPSTFSLFFTQMKLKRIILKNLKNMLS